MTTTAAPATTAASARFPATRPTVRAVTGTPASITIDSIGVSAPVVDLSKNADGTLQVPDWQDTGWWQRGPQPGERGPAVIVGHVDSKTGPAVFYRLRELTKGDTVRITLDDGRTVTYEVQRLAHFPKDHFPSFEVYGLTDTPELRLITCDGKFDRSTGHYVDNLIVYGAIVDP